jgi:fructose-specific phosphotransferase system component IIB
MKKRKIPRTYRLSAEAIALMEALAADMGIPHTSIVETALRDLAKRRKVEVSKEVRCEQ